MFTSRGNQAMRIRQMKACFPQKQTKSVPPSRMGLFMPERAACHPCPEEGSSPPPLPPHGLWWGVGSLQAVGKKWTFVWLRISVLRSTFKFSMVSITRHFKIKHSIFSPKLCSLWASHLREGYQRPSVVQTRNLGIIFTSQPHLLHHLLSPRWLWDPSLPSPSSPSSPRPALWHQLLPAPSTLSFPSLPSTHQGFPKHTLGDASAQFQPPWLPPAQKISAQFYFGFQHLHKSGSHRSFCLILSLSMYTSLHQFLNYSINFHTFMPLLMKLCSLLTVTKYLMPSQALGTVPNALWASSCLIFTISLNIRFSLYYEWGNWDLDRVVTSPFTSGSQMCSGMSSLQLNLWFDIYLSLFPCWSPN